MSLVAHTTGEADPGTGDEEKTLAALMGSLLRHNRLGPGNLIAARIGLPSGKPAPSTLQALEIRGIPVFWERLSKVRVEIFVRMKRRKRLRPLHLQEENP